MDSWLRRFTAEITGYHKDLRQWEQQCMYTGPLADGLTVDFVSWAVLLVQVQCAVVDIRSLFVIVGAWVSYVSSVPSKSKYGQVVIWSACHVTNVISI